MSATRPDVAIRYLGVMISGDGSAKTQVAKVVSIVAALIERVRTTTLGCGRLLKTVPRHLQSRLLKL